MVASVGAPVTEQTLHPPGKLYPHPYGWQFFPSDWTDAAQAARCHGLTYST